MSAAASRVLDLSRRCSNAARHYGVSYPAMVWRVLRLRAVAKFGPRETFLWGLADPKMPAGDVPKFISKRRLKQIQNRYNPAYRAPLTEDKALFYGLCRGYDLPVPEIYAVFHPTGGWAGERLLPTRRDAWAAFFDTSEMESFAIKPSRGTYAKGLRLIHRTPAGLVDNKGRAVSGAELYDGMAENREYSSFVVQELVQNDPELGRLTDATALQTARCLTVIDPDGEFKLITVALKIIRPGNISDNFDFGQSGNFLAAVDVDSGQVGDVMLMQDNGLGLRTIEKHPETGLPFAGFQVPHWPEALRVLEAAARKFLPVRMVGWDLAFAPRGPVFLEGNMYFDPIHNAHRAMQGLTDIYDV